MRGVVDDEVFALAEAGDAHRYAETGKAFGRIIIVP